MNDAIEKPWFLGLLVCHLVLWTLLPALLQHNAPLDVIEGLAWGQVWQWGYDKHPFLAPWLTQLSSLMSGGQAWSIYLLSQLAVVATFVAVWRLAKQILTPIAALASVGLLEAFYYYSFSSPEFNPNVLLLPLWAWAAYYFYQALQQQKVRYWLALGIFCGLGMVAKYFTAVIVVVMLLFLLTNRQARRSWHQSGIYLAMIVGFVIMLPNLIWLYQHDFISINYALNRVASITPVTGIRLLFIHCAL